MPQAGYSGTPLFKKLGIVDDVRVDALNAPSHYESLLIGAPTTASIVRDHLQGDAAFIHLFATSQERLEAQAESVVQCLRPGGILWVSWPKKSGALRGDIDDQKLRDVFLPLGVVDVKVCAIDQDWSGLKFLWRRKDR